MNVVHEVPDLVPIRNVLVSVWDKSKLENVIMGIRKYCPDVVFYSTGGTYKALTEILGDSAKAQLVQVSDYTGQPEMQGGLVKTLDYKIYLGLLSEPYNPDHQNDLAQNKAVQFDLTIVNLYPFSEATKKPNASLEDTRAYIDIGGPTMLRASAKNFLRVATVSCPDDYESFLQEIRTNNGCTSLEQRYKLSTTLFARTAAYDEEIARWMHANSGKQAVSCYTIKENFCAKP
jgi:phosphoribosylaminoimidazolecarboxamide formyltransferase/IMP cyclohydrolase